MRYLQYAHIANLVFLALYCLLAANLVYWIAWVVYCVVFLATLNHQTRWVRLTIVPPLLIFCFTVPLVLFNLFAFVSNDILYRNSPATIFVVLVFALLILLPSTVVLSLYWINRKAIFEMA